jgi:hypothetical protein
MAIVAKVVDDVLLIRACRMEVTECAANFVNRSEV